MRINRSIPKGTVIYADDGVYEVMTDYLSLQDAYEVRELIAIYDDDDNETGVQYSDSWLMSAYDLTKRCERG